MPRKMKTKKQIKQEIGLAKKTMENYRNAYKEGKIPKEVLKSAIADNVATIDALRWVLGENDRYD